ncbi:MAG: transcription termination/antitermination protein NusA [Oscillospiraceae bacterium]|nr:transcription termination/antitermination protein NusA [Oscillospiraceae bacterium]MBR2503741.1 transcription termination/antitermination protein NusA [Oscillospiraceae bacterium]
MNKEFFEALNIIEKEKGIKKEVLIEKITKAMEVAVEKDLGLEGNVVVLIDPEKQKFGVSVVKTIVETVEDPDTEISLEDARKIRSRSKLGGEMALPLKTKDFGYIAIGAAKNVIKQGIKEAEKAQLFEDMQSKTQEIVTGVVLRQNAKSGALVLQVGNNEFILPKDEQIPGEEYEVGDHVKVYVVDVLSGERGPRIMLSRTHPGFVKRMFELEVPEIFDGTVEIKAISREAGARTKIAVWSKDENVDAIGACIGAKRARIDNIIAGLGGEKIDIVKYSEDPAEFISAALSPSSVSSVEILSENPKSCKVCVPDEQLSLAIGNKGQNARLAARLTGFNIDIHPQSGYFGE